MKRVLFVGWEAADWHTIRPLLNRGVMPALANLVNAGVSGNIAPVQPALSPMLWTSLATGKRADKHGICSHFEPLSDRSGIQPVSSNSRKCQAIWNILSAAELNSQVINWPASSAEAIIGSMASDRFFSFPNDGATKAGNFLCYPAAKREEWRPLGVNPSDVGRSVLAPFFSGSNEERQMVPQSPVELAQVIASAASIHAVACRQIENEPWDFAAVRYPTIADWSSIPQWGCDEVPSSSHAAELARRQFNFEAAWRFQDELLSTLIRLAGEETTIVLISPLPAATALMPNPIRRFGIACMSGLGVRPKASLHGGTILDVAPTILSMLGLPIGDDMDGWPWQQVLINPPKIRRTPTWELIAERTMESARTALFPKDIDHDSPCNESRTEGIRACDIVLRNQKTNLAMALDDSNRSHLAVDCWKELVAEHPHCPEFSIRLLSSLMRNGELHECRRFIEQLTLDIAECPQVQLTLAELELRDRHLSEACHIAWEQAEKNPLAFALLNQAGNLLLKCQAWSKAELVFLKSLEAQSDNPIARNGLATAYWEEDRYEEAIRQVRQALEAAPAFPQARFNLARSLQSLGHEADAIEAFEYCLSMDYLPQETHGRLAALYRFRDPLRAKEHQLRAGVL